jgi:3-methylcrotonyl-CoA carboxylase alpha subunit
MNVSRIGEGAYRVEASGQADIVYVAGTPDRWWAFWNGRVFRCPACDGNASSTSAARHQGPQSLSSPMPATIRKILVTAGASVHRGDTLIVLEAMKMELPLRATGDATVTRIHCREGELVQPDTVLIDLETRST